jgi:hypothetical protein
MTAPPSPVVMCVIGRAERVTRVLDQREAVSLRDRLERFEIDGHAAEVNRDDRLGARPDQRLDARRIQRAASRVDVREPDLRAEEVRRRRGRGERDRGRDDLVAFADTECRVREMERRGAARAHGRMGGAQLGRERLLEPADQRPAREHRRAEHLDHRGDIRVVDGLASVGKHRAPVLRGTGHFRPSHSRHLHM